MTVLQKNVLSICWRECLTPAAGRAVRCTITEANAGMCLGMGGEERGQKLKHDKQRRKPFKIYTHIFSLGSIKPRAKAW